MHSIKIKTVLIGVFTLACCLISWAFASFIVSNQRGGGLFEALIDGHLGLTMPVVFGIGLDLELPKLTARVRKWLMVTIHMVGILAFIGYAITTGILADPSIDIPIGLKLQWFYISGFVLMVTMSTVLVHKFIQTVKSGGSIRGKTVRRVTVVKLPPGNPSHN
jgi:MFS family permease